MSGSRRRGSRDTSSTETTLLGAAALAATARSSRRRRGKPAFDVRRRRALVTVAILVVLLGGGVAGFATWLSGADEATAEAAPTVQEFTVLGPRYEPTAADRARIPTPITSATPLVGLTFDDGPTPERTPYVLDVLRAKGARATFFFQGDQVEKHPDIARRALAEGHVVGLHSYEHLYFPELDPQAAREQIVRSEEILTRELGVRPTLWRYPFGEASPAADAVLAERRLVGNVGWDWRSNLPGDFECAGADGLVRLIMTEAKDQAVILLHDGGDAIDCPDPQWEYLPRAIDRLRERGMEPGVVVPTGRARPLVSVVAP